MSPVTETIPAYCPSKCRLSYSTFLYLIESFSQSSSDQIVRPTVAPIPNFLLPITTRPPSMPSPIVLAPSPTFIEILSSTSGIPPQKVPSSLPGSPANAHFPVWKLTSPSGLVTPFPSSFLSSFLPVRRLLSKLAIRIFLNGISGNLKSIFSVQVILTLPSRHSSTRVRLSLGRVSQ